jgi:hypothetical protein
VKDVKMKVWKEMVKREKIRQGRRCRKGKDAGREKKMEKEEKMRVGVREG